MFRSGDAFPGDFHGQRIQKYRQLWQIQKGLMDAALGLEVMLESYGSTNYGRKIKREVVEELLSEVRIVAKLPQLIMRTRAGMASRGMSVKSEDKKVSEAISAALDASNWGAMRRQAFFTTECYGNAVLTPRRIEGGGGVVVDIRDPWTWFPEPDPSNPSVAASHVFAWLARIGDQSYLLQEIYESGQIVRKANLAESRNVNDSDDPMPCSVDIGNEVPWSSLFPGSAAEHDATGVDEPLVAVLRNWTDSTGLYGQSDLDGNETLAFEITNRLSQIGRILDIHADPKLTGPESATEVDPVTKEVRMKMRGSRYFPREDKEDPPFEYLTWESQLEHAFTSLRESSALLCTMMQMSPELVGLNTGSSAKSAEATETLRIRSFSTTAGIEDLRAFMADGARALGRLIAGLSAKKPSSPLSVEFGDPLPLSESERIAAIQAKRMAGVVSLETAVREANPNMPEPDIAKEIERIRSEEAGMYNPGQG